MKIFKPEEIEKESFAIITREMGATTIDYKILPIVKRVIHTTADFDYLTNLCFSENVVDNVLKSIKEGVDIITDTNMVLAGINKKALAKTNSKAHCFIADKDVTVRAKMRNTTRASIAMEKAESFSRPIIFAIGNAPTALLKIADLVKEKKINPLLVIGVPVGFVNVVESKEIIMESGVPYIVAKGRKGGSNVAAAIVNALLYMEK